DASLYAARRNCRNRHSLTALTPCRSKSGVYSRPHFTGGGAAARVAPINGRGDEELERLARSHRVAHTLRCLEFNLAGDQNRIAVSATGFIRCPPLRRRDFGSAGHFDRPGAVVTTQPGRLSRPRRYWLADVQSQIHPPLFGRAGFFVTTGGSPL